MDCGHSFLLLLHASHAFRVFPAILFVIARGIECRLNGWWLAVWSDLEEEQRQVLCLAKVLLQIGCAVVLALLGPTYSETCEFVGSQGSALLD